MGYKKDIEFLKSSELFDPDWYLENYEDVKKLSLSPEEHYLRIGLSLGRKPSEFIDVKKSIKNKKKMSVEEIFKEASSDKNIKSKIKHKKSFLNLISRFTELGRRDLANEISSKLGNSSKSEVFNENYWIEKVNSFRESFFKQGYKVEFSELCLSEAKKIIVYTCLYGKYEEIKEPLYKDPRVRYILYTDDRELKSNFWEIKYLKEYRSTIRRTSRIAKLNPSRILPEHDISIYIDSSLSIITPDIVGFVEICLKENDCALYIHHERDCIYQEIKICKDLGLEKTSVCEYFKKRYENLKVPEGNGLYENTLIIRKYSEKTIELNKLWEKYYMETGSQRDQLSFMLALEECKARAVSIPYGDQVRKNPFVKWTKHIRKSIDKPRVFKMIAYAPQSYDRNLGKAYNDYMARLSDQDVAVFVDHDAALLHEDQNKILNELSSLCLDQGCLVIGMTNRIGNPYQRLSCLEETHDLSEHYSFSKYLINKYHDELIDVTGCPSSSGVLMMLSKKDWNNNKFIDGFLNVDNSCHKSFRANNKKVFMPKSMYLYHFYRADGDLTHTSFDANKIKKVSDKKHFVRNFVYFDDEDLRVSDYLSILKKGEWAMYLHHKGIHCLKDWYLRVCSHLENMDQSKITIFNTNLLNVNGIKSNDYVLSRSKAINYIDSTDYDLDDIINQNGRFAFAISYERMRTLDKNIHVKDILNYDSTNIQLSRKIYVHVLQCNLNKRPSEIEVFDKWNENRRVVAILTLGFWPQQAGMEMFIHNLAEEMTRAGDLVVLFTPKPAIEFDEIEHNYIIRRYRNEDELIELFGKHHNSISFDALLVQGAFSAATLSLKIKNRYNVPVILRTHGEDIQVDPDIGYGYRLNPDKEKIIIHNISEVDHNIVIGSHIEKEVYSIDSKASVSTINNGVNIHRFKTKKSSYLRNKFDLKKETVILLTVGRNVPIKSLHFCIDALKALLDIGRDVVLIHSGKEGKGINLKNHAEKLNVQDNFFELGAVSYFDMPEIYASADIFIYTSKRETFGNVTIEAMSSGLPCVEFDNGASRDKIVHGETGFIVPYADLDNFSQCIDQLVVSSILRSEMAINARKRAEEVFDWPIIVSNYRKIIRATSGSVNYEIC